MSSERVRIYFTVDDPAKLWKAGDTGDDLGPEYPGSSARLLRMDRMDENLVLEDPYGRGLIRRIDDYEKPELHDKPPGFSDAELDEFLDSLDE